MPRPRKLPPTITASLLFDTSFAIHPAPRKVRLMNDTQGGFPYHCLPLVMANQAGWILTSGRTVLATWTGGSTPEDLTVESPEGEDPPASSQFGHGILSWEIPYVFRTSPGYNLLARGPANWWKDGAVPLEGLVETDWSVATFTMNWKLTTPGLEVRFEPDDPICMLVPQRRGRPSVASRISPSCSVNTGRGSGRGTTRSRDWRTPLDPRACQPNGSGITCEAPRPAAPTRASTRHG